LTDHEPDFNFLLMGAARVLSERVTAGIAAAGYDAPRPAYGFVLRALEAGPATATELGERLGVSKQAASKLVGEMVDRDLVQRTTGADRRSKSLALTPTGRAVLDEARAIGRGVEASIAPEDAAALRRALTALIENHGGLGGAAHRFRPVW
jgi:DNA-binding MarR family transcriptional regulator